MRLRFLFLTLALAGVLEKVCAQSIALEMPNTEANATEERFNASKFVNIQDRVYLKGGIVYFDLKSVKDYEGIKGIDTVLRNLLNDIQFYRDSLDNGSGNVRIDYSLTVGKTHRELRFIKYPHRGESFVLQDGETQRLKIENDTVRIVWHLFADMFEKKATTENDGVTVVRPPRKVMMYKVQATLILDKYTDIQKILEEREILRHAMDTFVSVRTGKEIVAPFLYPTWCRFRPYVSDSFRYTRFYKSGNLDISRDGNFSYWHPRLTFFVNGGAGVVRNSISPTTDIGIAWNRYLRRKDAGHYITALSASPYFFFERGSDRNFYMSTCWFVNLEAGGTFDHDMLDMKLKSYSWGVGYLALQNGDTFKGITTKVFFNARLANGLFFCPELLATNTFKQIFPGITMKVKVI
ncbi:MAG: hypothetical protein KF744_03350 [Taibaiella sp.]|nr:hypothetical protein [Taibaiella sp.]